MVTCVKLKSGSTYYTNQSFADVRTAISTGEVIPVWWFAAWGQRYSEELWVPEDELAYLLTESDDG